MAPVRIVFLFAAFLFSGFLFSSVGYSQNTYYWEPQSIGQDGVLTGGSGSWTPTSTFFTTSPTDALGVAHVQFNNQVGGVGALGTDTIVFGGTAGTVTISGYSATTGSTNQLTGSSAVGITGLTFDTSGYTLTGGTIKFIGNGLITVGAGKTATINSSISQSPLSGYTVIGPVTVDGGGLLNYSGTGGSNAFTIQGNSTVVLSGNGQGMGGTTTTVNAGSVFRLNNANIDQIYDGSSTVTGAGTFDMNGETEMIGIISGALSVTNSTNTGASVLIVQSGNQTHTGVISDGTGTMSFRTAGSTTNGTINDSVSMTLAGANTYTGNTTLGKGGLTLNFSNAAAPSSDILYNGTTFTANKSGLIIAGTANTNGITSNTGTGSRVTLTVAGKDNTANSQRFNGLTLNTNSQANILLNPSATGNTVTLDLGAITRNSGSLLNFSTTNSTTALSANATVKSSSGTAGTTLTSGGTAYATIGGRDWAAKNTANDSIVAIGNAATTATYTNNTNSTLSGNATTVTAGGGSNDTRLAANTTITTLRYNNSTGRSAIHLDGKTLTTGGVLFSNVLTNTGSFLSGGTLTGAGSDLTIVNYSPVATGVGATIADGASATGLTTGGSGTTRLYGNNTYTGALTVNEGTLIATGSNSTASSININGSTTNLTGAQIPSTTTSGTMLQLGNANSTGSLGNANITIGVNSILGIKRSDSFTLNNNVSGSGGITQAWSGTTTLLSAATPKYSYLGDTTVNAGTLKLDYSASNTGIINDNSQLVLGGGTLELATVSGTTHAEVVRQFTINSGGGTITRTGAGTGLLRLNSITTSANAGSTLNFTSGGIADTDTINTNGILGARARFTVGSENTYDWAFSANGSAADTPITALNSVSYTTLASSSSSNTLNFAMRTSGSNAITLSTAAALANTLKIDSSAATGTNGATTLTLGAGNSLSLTAGGLLTTGENDITITGGTLFSNSGSPSDLIIHQYNTSTNGLTIASVISNGQGITTLTKSGSGLLNLTNTNTYTGATYLNGGTTVISSNANLGATGTGASIVLNNGTLRVTSDVILSNGAVGTNNRPITLNGVGGTFEVDASRTLTIGGSITGPGGLTKTGAGTLDIRSASYSGPTNINAGTLKLGAAVNNTWSPVIIGSAGTLDAGGSGSFIGSLEGSGTFTNTGAANTITLGVLHNDTTFSGQITNGTNALSIDKAGSGTWTLTGGLHNYTGSTTVSGGSLILSGAGALPDTTAFNLSSATANVNFSGITASSETIRTLAGVSGSTFALGAKSLAVGDDFGTVNVTSATTTGSAAQQSDIVVSSIPTYLTVGSGILGRTVTGINTGTNTITLNGTANISISASTPITVYPVTGDTTFTGTLSGTGGSFTKDGSGSLTLSSANTYTGQTTIDRGALIVTNANALGTTDTGTRINYSGNTSGGRLDIGGGITLNEVITLAGERFGSNFTSGFRAISGNNTLTNTLMIDGDTSSEFRLGANNSGTVLNLANGVARTGTSATNAGLLLFSATSGTTINFNGAIDNNGNTIEFADGGVNVLNVVSSDVGQTQVDYNGFVKLGINNALPSTQNLRVGLNVGSTSSDTNAPVGTLDMAGFNLAVARLEGSAGATGVTSDKRKITNSASGNSLLTIGAASTNQTFDGIIENGSAGGTIAVTKTLANTQTLSGNIANTYSGLTTIEGGSLILAKSAGVNAIGGNVTIGDGVGNDILQLTNSDQISNISLLTFFGTGTNAGIFRLNNQNETVGGLISNLSAGIIENSNANAGTSTLTTDVSSGTQTYTGILRNNSGSGSGILAYTKAGSGTQVLAGTNSYTGATLISNGTLQLGDGGTTGSLSTSSAITNNGTFVIKRNNTTTQGIDFATVLNGAGALHQSGSGRTIINSASSFTGDMFVTNGILELVGSTNANSTIRVGTSGTLEGTGNILGNATLDGNGVINKQSGTISGTLVVTGGNWNGNGTVTGVVASSDGNFQIGNGANLIASSGVTVTGGTISAGNSSSTITGSLSYTSPTSSTFQGVIAGTGNSLTLNNASANLNLTGANTYTGGTTVTSGTLSVNNTTGSGTGTGAVTIQNGGTLAGTGTVSGPVTFKSGATHSPGNSPGIQLFTGGATYETGSSFRWELIANTESGRGTNFDGVNVNNGLLTIEPGVTSNLVFNGAGSSVAWSDTFWNTNRQWLVFSNFNSPSVTTGIFSNIIAGFDSTGASLAIDRGSFSWNRTGNDLFVQYTVTAVPEPGTLGTLGALFAVGWFAHRRSLKRSLRK